MSAAGRSAARIRSLADAARTAWEAGEAFDAERHAVAALDAARAARAWEHLAEIVAFLRGVRSHRVDDAIQTGRVEVLDELPDDPEEAAELDIEPGMIMLRPMLVAADARRLRLSAFERGIPVLVVCREPDTDAGLVPVVAIAPGATIREKVPQPDDPDQPSADWMQNAYAALASAAVTQLDPEMQLLKRMDALLARLDALPDDAAVHDAAVECAEQLLANPEEAEPGRRRRKASA